MISRRSALLVFLVAAVASEAPPLWAASRRHTAVKMFDTDDDGTLDLKEVKKAASRLFAKLDHDHDGTVDRRELGGRLTVKEFAMADPDHDGTLTLEEYLSVAERLFNAANPHRDGTLGAKELNSRPGLALLRLLR